jgi:prepilin-type N-terminal cleavage/methylation domain-containing protein/prepilin-type processing-associated H-X9-DG protein
MKIQSPRLARTRSSQSGFTLIELLVVIAIIAILAAILFPVFAQARERARVASCSSNLKQFMLGITMYTQDYDETMPLAWKIKGQVGAKIGAPGEQGAGRAPQGLWFTLMPYVKSQEIFRCPNDPKFYGDKVGNKVKGQSAIAVTPGRYTYYEATGQSYKFTKDNFSMPAEVAAGTDNNNGLDKKDSDDRGDMSVRAAGSTGTFAPPPSPMSMAFFARPTETRVIRDLNAPWEKFEGTPNGFEEKNAAEIATHSQGINVAFADGHVKFITSKATMNSFCDGPTLSPARSALATDNFAAGDGSCNSGGVERKTR